MVFRFGGCADDGIVVNDVDISGGGLMLDDMSGGGGGGGVDVCCGCVDLVV